MKTALTDRPHEALRQPAARQLHHTSVAIARLAHRLAAPAVARAGSNASARLAGRAPRRGFKSAGAQPINRHDH